MYLCYVCIFVLQSSFFLLHSSNCEKDDEKLCPNQMQTDELRDEFTLIVHLIEKRHIGKKSGWQKFAKFLTFLAPTKRTETVNAFCAKINESSDENRHQGLRKTKHHHQHQLLSETNEQCLEKIFWPSNAELAKLKKANLLPSMSKYNEVAKMLEGMLKRREQLMAEILHKALTITAKQGDAKIDENFEISAEILLARPKHELVRVVVEYNAKFKNASPSKLLYDIRQKIDPKKGQQKYDYEILADRIYSIHKKHEINGTKLVNNIFEKCNDWRDWLEKWNGDETLTQMFKMNNLLRELLIFFEYNSTYANCFATNFKFFCIEFINYMQKMATNSQPSSPVIEKKNSWIKNIFKNKNKQIPTRPPAESSTQKAIVARKNFTQIWRLFEIAGLLEIGSEYVYLARKLNDANLKKNSEDVSRIICLHVGTDILKILANLRMLPNRAPIAKSKFTGMFQVAYTEILQDTQDNCYQLVEPIKATNFVRNVTIVQPVRQNAATSRHIKLARPNKEILEFKKEKSKPKNGNLNNLTKNKNSMPKFKQQQQVMSPTNFYSSSSETDGTFYSPENFEIDETPQNLQKFSEPQMPRGLAVQKHKQNWEIQVSSSENDQQFYSPNIDKTPEMSNKNLKFPEPQNPTSSTTTNWEIEEVLSSSENDDQQFHSPKFEKSNKKVTFSEPLTRNLSNSRKPNQKLEIGEMSSSENDQQFHSPNFVAADQKDNNNNNGDDLEHGINYLKLFNEFTSLFLNDPFDDEAKQNWKELKFSHKIADIFLDYLTRQCAEKILKRKWKIFGHKKLCKPMENVQFAELFLPTNDLIRRITILSNKWRGIMAKINLNFFKILILFGLNLADHRQAKLGKPKQKIEKKAKEKLLKIKAMLSNALGCFPPIELGLGDNFENVMTRLVFVTEPRKENMENVIHVFQLVERNGELHAENDD